MRHFLTSTLFFICFAGVSQISGEHINSYKNILLKKELRQVNMINSIDEICFSMVNIKGSFEGDNELKSIYTNFMIELQKGTQSLGFYKDNLKAFLIFSYTENKEKLLYSLNKQIKKEV